MKFITNDTTHVSKRICLASGDTSNQESAWVCTNAGWVLWRRFVDYFSKCDICDITNQIVHRNNVGRSYDGNVVSMEAREVEVAYGGMDRFIMAVFPKALESAEKAYNEEGGLEAMLCATPCTGLVFKSSLSGMYFPIQTKIRTKQTRNHPSVIISSVESDYMDAPYMRCARCNHTFHTEDVSDDGYCPNCQKIMEEEDIIRPYNYHHHPDPITTCKKDEGLPEVELRKRGRYSFVGGKLEPNEAMRLFGVELEIEYDYTRAKGRNRAWFAKQVLEAVGKDFVYCKHDGSLSGMRNDGSGGDYGFEVVSAPATLDVHRERWEPLENAKGYAFLRAWDTQRCGMHVHMNRAMLSSLQIGRMGVFLNHPDNAKFIKVVAGRSPNKYCKYIEKHLTDSHPDRRLENNGHVDDNGAKYQALRTNLKETVEVRIFRGTVNYRHIIRNIEFCSAMIDFCWPAGRSFSDLLDYKKFLAFCEERRNQYPIFCEWAAHENFIKRMRPKPGVPAPKVAEANEKELGPIEAKPKKKPDPLDGNW